MRLLLLLGAIGLARAAQAADCNRNGIEDDIDIEVASPGLSPRARFATPRGAAGLALADMDGDGLLDLVAHSESEDDVHELLVLLSPGPWRTSEPRRLGIGDQSPTEFAVGDIDSDGDPDVVTLTGPGASVHRNDGDGGLETIAPVVIGAVPASVALGDLDGDGLLDIATANSSLPDGGVGNVSVALGAGGGAFHLARNYASGGLGLALVAADLDGDLDADLALTLREPESTIAVLLNDGGAAFLEDARSDPSLLPYPIIHHLAPGDLDGDGAPDLVVTSPDGGGSFHRNIGAALFVTAEILTPDAGDQPAVIEDLDGDGDLDVALALRACPEIEVFVNDGGSFGDSRRFPVERPSSGVGGAVLLRAGDLDGDGDPDITGLGKRSISLLENAPSGTSTDCNGNLIPDDCEVDCDGNGIPDECDIRDGAGDCDGDGLLDACDPRDEDASSVPDACEIASGAAADCDRNGRIDAVELEPFLAFPQVAESYLYIDTISSGDLDGDGVAELVVSADGALRLLRARSLDLAKGFLETRLATGALTAVELADWDADGDIDIAAAGLLGSCGKGGEAVALVLGNGGSADLSEAAAYGVSSPVPVSARAGDLDRDGVLDLLLFRPQEGVSWLKGVAGLVFEDESPALPAPGGLAIGSKGMVAADLDGDLDTDLALSGGGVYLHEGSLEFRRSFELPTGPIEAGDLDGDADVDLLLGNTLFRNDFGGVFSPLTELGPPADGVLVADLDGDGKDDAALSAAGRLDVFFQRGGDSLEHARFHPLATFSDSRLAAGDLNGDGFTDIAGASSRLGLITIYPGRPPFDPEPEFHSAGLVGSRFTSIHAGDLDGDGDDDLVATRPGDVRQPIVVLVAAGGRLAQRGPPPFLLLTASLALEDMDSDGDPDLVLTAGGIASVGRNTGDGSFLPDQAIQLAENLRATQAADLDLDGDLDLVGEEPNGLRFPTAFRSGEGFALGPIGQIGAVSAFILLPDTDGDGDPDLIAGTRDAVLVRENDGAGHFAPRAALDAGGPAAAGATGDWNGDGTPDIAVALERCVSCGGETECICGALAVFLNGGLSGFGGAFRITLPGEAVSLATGDLDRDGDLDLIAPLEGGPRPEANLAALILLGDGDGGFERWGIVPALERPRAAALGDIDADGYPDIAIASDIGLTVHRSRAEPPSGIDADGDGRIDGCAAITFRRGDWNQDAALDITDPITILGHLFLGGPAAACLDAGDADDSGDLSITDPIRILMYLFQGEIPPAGPLDACGVDPTEDDLGCVGFAPCRL